MIGELDGPWRAAFDEAWAAFGAGNFGIGAVLVDPSTGEIVARGRNRVGETRPASRIIGGNFLAHAEMNAFAAMESFFARGLHLYTTLEPCLMCSATAIQLNVEHIHFAAADEFFVGLDDLWTHHEYTRTRAPRRSGPLGRDLAAFARLLPLTYTLCRLPDGNAAATARRDESALADLAERFALSDEFDSARRSPSVVDAFDAVRPHLPVP